MRKTLHPPPPHIRDTKSEQRNTGYINGYRFKLSPSTIWRNPPRHLTSK